MAPAAHYYMGGIRTDLNARTSIPGPVCGRRMRSYRCHGLQPSCLQLAARGARLRTPAPVWPPVADGDDAVWAPEPFLNSATGAVFDHAPIALAAPCRYGCC